MTEQTGRRSGFAQWLLFAVFVAALGLIAAILWQNFSG
jgi:hypothetical protein